MNFVSFAAAVLTLASCVWSAVLFFWLALAVRRGESSESVRCHAWCAAGTAVMAAVFGALWALTP